jgi:hypothetical protein
LSRRFVPLFVLMVFALAASSGCVALPATGSASPSGSREPVVELETAVPIVTAEPTATTVVAATSAAPDSPLPTPTPVASATASAEATAEPAATETSAASVVPPAATAASTPGPATYRGPNPYRATPAFEVTYDPAVWEYVADDGSGRPSQLKHRAIAGCAIWLRAGPVGAQKMADVWLADRAWSLNLVQPKVIQYVSPQDDIAWIFGVMLNEEWSGRGNSMCQDAAELVIGTFKVVPAP